MSLFFKEPKPRTKNVDIWVDDPRYGVMMQDNVPAGDPGYTQLSYSKEMNVRELVDKLCNALGLPENTKHVEIEISFE